MLRFCRILFLLYMLLSAEGLFAKTLTRVVGSIGDSYITSREVEIQQFLEHMIEGKSVEQFVLVAVDQPGFDRVVSSYLLEKVIALEAEDFSVATVDDTEVTGLLVRMTALEKNPEWKKRAIDSVELQLLAQRKLRAKKMIKYKTDTASIPITDGEIKQYFEKNRYKFGNLPLENFKENIRSFLIKQQLENALREWFEVLNKKYKVRNYEGESGS